MVFFSISTKRKSQFFIFLNYEIEQLFQLDRAMVRAKVAGIRAEQEAGGVNATDLGEQMLAHLRWAERWLARPPGRLVLMSGLSGSVRQRT